MVEAGPVSERSWLRLIVTLRLDIEGEAERVGGLSIVVGRPAAWVIVHMFAASRIGSTRSHSL
jgi:hypothetical protein